MTERTAIFQELIAAAIAEETFRYEPYELFEPIAYTMSLGGKRIRPLITLMACDMFGGSIEDALFPSVGLEVFHNFTLIHDDILDNASIRRGQPTVYKKWDLNRAILSGDTMFAMSYKYFFRTRSECIVPILDIFNQTAIEVCRGQQYDMNFETRQDVDIPTYIEMIRLKTAVLLGASARVGAIIGGATEKQAENLYHFAENLGLAFQLKDDMLDLYSDQDVFGKKIGGDISANKKTYLFLRALELADAVQKNELCELFGITLDDNTKKIESVRRIYDALNIQEHTTEAMNIYLNKALDSLSDVDVPEQNKHAFRAFSDMLMKREK